MFIMKKRILSVGLLIAALFAILVGCSDDNNEQAAESKDELIIGIDDTFAPMGFRDDNNEIVGFDIDLARATGEQMGKEVVFQPIDWGSKELELSSGRIDLIWNGYTITEERAQKVLLTKPYLANNQVIVTLKDSEIEKFDDLKGKKIGIQAQSSAIDAWNAVSISQEVADLFEDKTNDLALTGLESNRVDAVVIDEVVMNYKMMQKPDTFKILDEKLAPEEYAVGVAKDNEELLSELQAAIDEIIADGTAAEISRKVVWRG